MAGSYYLTTLLINGFDLVANYSGCDVTYVASYIHHSTSDTAVCIFYVTYTHCQVASATTGIISRTTPACQVYEMGSIIIQRPTLM